jgi:hypothetical protein
MASFGPLRFNLITAEIAKQAKKICFCRRNWNA